MTLLPRQSDAELERLAAERTRRGIAGSVRVPLPPHPHLAELASIALGPGPGAPEGAPRPAPRAPRAPKKDAEHGEQADLFTWIDEQPGPEWSRLYAIPNFAGFHGSKGARKASGARAKAEGRRKGMLDVCWPLARGGWFGLYLEMKTETGALSSAQRGWIEYLRAENFRVDVATSAEVARAVLLHYYSLPRTTVLVR